MFSFLLPDIKWYLHIRCFYTHHLISCLDRWSKLTDRRQICMVQTTETLYTWSTHQSPKESAMVLRVSESLVSKCASKWTRAQTFTCLQPPIPSRQNTWPRSGAVNILPRTRRHIMDEEIISMTTMGLGKTKNDSVTPWKKRTEQYSYDKESEVQMIVYKQ